MKNRVVKTKDSMIEEDVCLSKMLLLSTILPTRRNYLELLDLKASIKIPPLNRIN